MVTLPSVRRASPRLERPVAPWGAAKGLPSGAGRGKASAGETLPGSPADSYVCRRLEGPGGRETAASAAVAALELLAGAAGAGVVAPDLAPTEARAQGWQRLERGDRLAQRARAADALELAHVVVVEREHQLDGLGRGRTWRLARHQSQPFQQLVGSGRR